MTDTDEFTRLADPVLDEVHAVKGAANGTPFLVAKSEAADSAQGLFGPEFVREMIAKAEAAEPASREPVTLSGSPAAVADMMARIHGASVRKADMPTADINDLPDSAFAYIEPGGEKDADGKTTPRSKRHFPVHDKAHADNAAARIAQGAKFGDQAKSKVAAAQRKFGEKVAKADSAPTDPGSPTWESADAADAESVTARILACIPAVRALVMREATEVGAGHTDDICDVLELQAAIDALTCAAKSVAAFAASEHAEAGETGVAKAQQPAAPPAATEAASPKENTVDTTTTEVTKAEGDAAAAGTEQTQPVSKAAALAAQLGISAEQLAEIGAQAVLKAAAAAVAGTGEPQTTGAEVAPTDARVIPGTDTVQAPPQAASDDVSKAEATQQLATAFGQAVAPVVEQLHQLATQVGAQVERVEKFAAKADNTRSPFLNGATGAPGTAQRDAGPSTEMQAILKAIDAIPAGPARDEAKRTVALQALATRFGG